jgi:Tfp pilus assembly protein PilF
MMSTADHSRTSPDPARFIGLFLALATLLVYLPVCFHDFILFDDPTYVTDNPVVQDGISWAGIKWAFAGWHASNWHPLTWLSHMLDCQLFGLNAGAQHFVNALFHAANALLLFRLWRRLTGALWPSAVVAALFAWHPLRVESVAWISERKDVLSTFFGLLSTAAYARFAQARSKTPADRGRGIDYTWALGLFALSLMSKPMLVTLPFLFLVLDFWPLQWLNLGVANRPSLARLVGEKLPFLVLSAASSCVTFLAQRGEAVMTLGDRSLGLRLETAVIAYWGYLVKTVWPAGLGIIYPLPKSYPLSMMLIAAAGLLLIAMAVWCRRQSPWLVTGWLWFLGTLVPVIGLVQAGDQAMADRYTYWPAIGLSVAIVFEVAHWVACHPALRMPAQVAAGLALIGCVAGTERQLGFWKDTKTLYAHTVAVTGDNPEAEMMLGLAWEPEDQNKALGFFDAALKSNDALAVRLPGGTKRRLAVQAALLRAQAAAQSGDATNAVALYRAALGMDGSLVEAHNNLGNLLEQTGKLGEAQAEYETAIALAPAQAQAHENLGALLLDAGHFSEAMDQYAQAVTLAPTDSHAFYLMGKAWLRQGQAAQAAASFRQALRCNGDDVQALAFLARILASDESSTNRDGSSAVVLAEKANTLTGGGQPFILDILAMSYAEAGRMAEAQSTAAKALNLAQAAKLPALAEGIREHLRSFQNGLPIRQTFTNSLSSPQ